MKKLDIKKYEKRYGITLEDVGKIKKGKKDVVLYGQDKITEGGFAVVPNFVLRHKKISGKAKMVYTVLVSYAYGNKNSCFPGQETMAKNCGMSIKSVQRGLKELEKEEFILIVRRGLGKTNVYVLLIKSVKDNVC